LIFTLLDPALHDRQGFSCGEPSLDAYLKNQATQDINRRAAVVYVMTSNTKTTEIIGYYTLSASSVQLQDIPAATQKKLARYPAVAASLIGRLAVSGTVKGKGFGKLLLRDTFQRIVSQSKDLAITVIIVDALNEDAENFYKHYGFMSLTNQGNRLYLPVATVEKAL